MSSNLPITCGIFLFHCNDLLICHPTGADSERWSIPKGMKENDENSFQTAMREFKEETGFDVCLANSINPMGEMAYRNKRKILFGYIAFIDGEKPTKFSCVSLTPSGKPENDMIKWVHVRIAVGRIHEAQRNLLLDFLSRKEAKNDLRLESIRELLF